MLHMVNVTTGKKEEIEIDDDWIRKNRTFQLKINSDKEKIVADGKDFAVVSVQAFYTLVDGTEENVQEEKSFFISFLDGQYHEATTDKNGLYEFQYSTFIPDENSIIIRDEVIQIFGEDNG